MKPLQCLHPALNHGDTPGERCPRCHLPSVPAGSGASPAFARVPSPVSPLPVPQPGRPRNCRDSMRGSRRGGSVTFGDRGTVTARTQRPTASTTAGSVCSASCGLRADPCNPLSWKGRGEPGGQRPASGDPAGAGSVLSPRPQGSAVGGSELGLGEKGRPGKRGQAAARRAPEPASRAGSVQDASPLRSPPWDPRKHRQQPGSGGQRWSSCCEAGRAVYHQGDRYWDVSPVRSVGS